MSNIPSPLLAVRNTAELANVNVLADAIAPAIPPSILRITVAYSAAAVFKAVLANGGTSATLSFNGGTALVADALFAFDLPVFSGDTLNFQFSLAGTLRVLTVAEIKSWGP